MGDRWGSRETPVMKSITAKQRYGTPPRVGSLGYWKPTVPSWEKEFCASVCFIPWSKVLETKKIMSLYANVVQWDDSAGEEAFTNAKKRFWAKINDLPCDVSLPDPDIYIDRIDWDSIAAAATDPELLNSMEEEIGEGDRLEVLSIIWENQDISAIPCSGWGDEDDANQVRAATTQNKDGRLEQQNSWDACEIHPNQDKGNAPIRSSGWGDAGVQDSPVNNHGAASGWGEEFDDWAPEKYQQENQRLTEFSNYDQSLRGKSNWANGNGNGRRREGGRVYGPWHMKTTGYRPSPGQALPANRGGGRRNYSREEGDVVGKY